jgi:hypothetical protein
MRKMWLFGRQKSKSIFEKNQEGIKFQGGLDNKKYYLTNSTREIHYGDRINFSPIRRTGDPKRI